jgi:hypothetical protein
MEKIYYTIVLLTLIVSLYKSIYTLDFMLFNPKFKVRSESQDDDSTIIDNGYPLIHYVTNFLLITTMILGLISSIYPLALLLIINYIILKIYMEENYEKLNFHIYKFHVFIETGLIVAIIISKYLINLEYVGAFIFIK